DRILDIGSGSGRDLAHLVREGRQAYGVEPSKVFRQLAVETHPELRDRILDGSLPDSLPDPDLLGGPFDGILCSATLQHIPRERLFDAAFSLKSLLGPRGRILLSIPSSRPDLDPENRDSQGRLFTPISPGELELLLERTGFRSIGRWTDSDSLERAGIEWTTLLFEIRTTGVIRPLDAIQSVLSQDRKVATYKFALVRALCEIAETRPRIASWRPDGRVAVPIEAVADLWILYYWPIFTSSRFLPQMNGEWSSQKRGLGFARELTALIDAYEKGRGGLTAFAIDHRNGAFPESISPLYGTLLKKLKVTIHTGPVTHAGGSLETGPLFGYQRGKILVDGPLWHELTLMSHWIRDALVLRWAEKTSDLSSGEILPDQAVNPLLTRADPDRETRDARNVYEELPDLQCTWTGRPITRFEVDHLIPFSLWRNNDLWNLVPASPDANQKKRDKLPSRQLLQTRQDTIFHYWETTRNELPTRFLRESTVFSGTENPSLETLFLALQESVEFTALQRNCARWELV
ncbi:MAG: HNH endonuclease domain-containing protein, partial [Planctomycetota bacterium]|nr:HNH endonuclease domain-containing protein [Planctomycetota bacterium]